MATSIDTTTMIAMGVDWRSSTFFVTSESYGGLPPEIEMHEELNFIF